jgi:serine/threonine protein kinase
MVNKSEALFNFLVSFSAVKIGQELGRGAFGVVYLATLRNETIACKMISKEALHNMNQEEFLQEARTMSELPRHPNVIQLVGFCRDEEVCILSGRKKRNERLRKQTKISFFPLRTFIFLLFLTEYIGGGCLRTLLSDFNIPLKVAQQLQFMREIANGMAHLHRHNLIHRDLAARNILLREQTLECVVTDFGLSRKMTDGDDAAMTKTNIGPLVISVSIGSG